MRAWLAVAIGCGASPSPPSAPPGPPASLVATAASTDDVQVATVNGRPVWGSCVAAQAPRAGSRDAALAECIDFELLAQAAEARGLAADPEVIDATRSALVSELVARDYEDRYRQPSDFGPHWNRYAERMRYRLDHAEVRTSAYARIEVPKQATAADDDAARAVAEEIAAALADERGLTPAHFEEIAKRVAGGRGKLAYAQVGLFLRAGLEAAYGAALFAIPEVGRTSPAVRTPWGWDVILFTDLLPETRLTQEQLIAAMLPEIKRTYFPQWINQIAQKLGARVRVFEHNLPLLERP